MWVIGHVAVGYLLWSGWVHVRSRRPPTTGEVWLVVLGSLFPDLVDKPLAWELGVLPAGRSLAHSLLTAAVVVWCAARVARRWEREPLAVAFGVAYVGHSVADAIGPLVTGEYRYAYYLLWPLLELPYYDTARSVIDVAHPPSPWTIGVHHLAVVAGLVAIWVLDGTPGVPGR